MTLSPEDRERIREEEVERHKIRKELEEADFVARRNERARAQFEAGYESIHEGIPNLKDDPAVNRNTPRRKKPEVLSKQEKSVLASLSDESKLAYLALDKSGRDQFLSDKQAKEQREMMWVLGIVGVIVALAALAVYAANTPEGIERARQQEERARQQDIEERRQEIENNLRKSPFQRQMEDAIRNTK